MSQQHPLGFMSYARFDDAHENGRLSDFCKRLSGEVRLQGGDEFPIFQDRNDIHWGQRWRQRIEESLDAGTFLIPILTPGFFKSEACREELERFLEREKRLGRNDLILPVYYVNCPVWQDKQKRQGDSLANLLWSRQYVDWREVRFEPFTSPQIGKMLAGMATQIVEALERGRPARAVEKALAAGVSQQSAHGGVPTRAMSEGEATARASSGPVHKTEPPTRVVDWFHRGDHASLTEALQGAKPGDRILVRPGLYKEGIVIDKPVEIVGDGELGEVVIEASGKDAVLFQATMGRIANLTLRQAGGGDYYCVDIAQGRLELEGCDITSQSLACVGIHDGADPRLLRNRIHDGKDAGVFVYDDGQGTIEDNEIFGNAMAGVAIRTGGDPTLRNNRIHDGKQDGIFVWENGKGRIEDNDIFGNATVGVEIKTGGDPTLRNNRIHDGKHSGVFVYESGKGAIEDNDIFGNATAGVNVQEGGNPTLRRNRIGKNAYEAIWVHDGGQGTYEDNDLRDNGKGAWDIAPDCLANVTRSGNKE